MNKYLEILNKSYGILDHARIRAAELRQAAWCAMPDEQQVNVRAEAMSHALYQHAQHVRRDLTDVLQELDQYIAGNQPIAHGK